MPSIPQSLLWISLVVLWLFVLVPMLINKREAVRRTSDVALATRVLNSGATARLIKRGGPAAGHRSNPDWRPEVDQDDDLDEYDADEHDADDAPRSRAMVVTAASASIVEAEPDYLDVEVVDEDSAALPVGESAVADERPKQVDEDPVDEEYLDAEAESDVEESTEKQICEDESADQYEYVDDTSGIPVAEEVPVSTPAVSRRHRSDSTNAAAVSARKYEFRKRVLMTMALILVGSAAVAFLLAPALWWLCGSTAGLAVLYLGYLRRQTRIEEQVRRRRMQRMARSRLGVENTSDREFDVVPARLRRPGAVVLEIDDEDPVFDHLDYAPYTQDYGWHSDLPRAVGE
jgi:hypothetical protein